MQDPATEQPDLRNADQAQQRGAVLRRKLRTAQVAEAPPPRPGPERMIGLAIAKAAQDRLGLELDARSMVETRASLAELPELIEDMSLLLMIEGPRDAMGLISVPGSTLSAILEIQTMGKIGRTTPPPRKPTRMDAAMTVELIDAILAGIDAGLAGTQDAVWATGFRYASCLDDTRPIGLLMEDVSYRVWTMQLGIGAKATREGGLLWIVPEEGRAQRSLPVEQKTDPVAAPPPDPEWARRMERAVMGTQTTLEAILHRVSLPLSVVMGLRPGMDIPLPDNALSHLHLEADGRAVATVKLGQVRGMRAVRLTQDDNAKPEGMDQFHSEADQDQARLRRSTLESAGTLVVDPDAPDGGGPVPHRNAG